LLSDPSKLLSVLGQFNQLMQFSGKVNAARAFQSALKPDGTIDSEKLAAGMKSPGVSMGGPEAIASMLDLHNRSIANDTAAFEQWAKQSDYARANFTARANQTTPITSEQIFHDAVSLTRNADPRVMPSSIVAGMTNSILSDPSGVDQAYRNMANRVLGAGAFAPVPGPPGVGGAPTAPPLGATVRGGVNAPPVGPQSRGFSPMVVGQPPGEQGVQEAGAARASDLQATASTTAQYHSDLENLKQDSRILENLQGPTVEVEKKLNALSSRLGGFGVTMTPDQMRAADSFDKIVNQISLNQSKLFHGSDASLHTVVGATPSLSMSRFGREGVIDMLQGNQDAVDLLRKQWLDARAKGAPANSYDTFVNEWSKKLDPRVFQFNRLNRENQQKFLGQIDPEDFEAFKQKYNVAMENGWVKKPKPAQ
jgi:hypothetical protein